jgi:hypothetical protein
VPCLAGVWGWVMTEAEIISQLEDLSRYLRQPSHDIGVAIAIAEKLRAHLLAQAQADTD